MWTEQAGLIILYRMGITFHKLAGRFFLTI